MTRLHAPVAGLIAICAGTALAQAPEAHALGPALARSTTEGSRGTPVSARVLPSGAVIVNRGRTVTLLDPNLAFIKTVRDTEFETISLPPGFQMIGDVEPTKGRRFGLAPFRGDSTAITGTGEFSLSILDLSGTSRRTMASSYMLIPELLSVAEAKPAVDAQGRLVLSGRTLAPLRRIAARTGVPRDSAPIIRVSFNPRRVDSLAFVRVGTTSDLTDYRDSEGRYSIQMKLFPFSVDDAWGVLTDGSLLIVRSDCSMLTIRDDGRQTGRVDGCSARALSPHDKQAALDSLASHPQNGFGDGVTRIVLATAAELPDEWPMYSGRSIADADGHLWVARNSMGDVRRREGDTFDVIDAKGVVVDRVRIPAMTSILGFGRGTVLLALADGTIEKRAIR